METSYSGAWFETFGRPDEAQTEREVAFLLRVLPPPPASVLVSGETGRMQLVFRRG